MTFKECWSLYSDKISFCAFQKVWEGITWKGVHDDVYTDEIKQRHILEKKNPGEKNGNAIYSDEEILEIRKYYTTHTLLETYKKFGKTSSLNGFRSSLSRTYTYIPKYSKIRKTWILNGKEININSFEL